MSIHQLLDYALNAKPASKSEALILDDIRTAWALFPEEKVSFLGLIRALYTAFSWGLIDKVEYEIAHYWLIQ
jgi:hypothetical protein